MSDAAEPPGRVDNWHDRTIAGIVPADDTGLPPIVEFRVDGRLVGRALADGPGAEPGALRFSATLPIEGDAVQVVVSRADGRALVQSPVLLHPAPAPFVGTIEGWHERTVAGFAVPDEDGAPAVIEFRADGRVVGTALASLPRDGAGGGFEAVLDIAGGEVLVSAWRQADGHALAGSPVLLHPGEPVPPPAPIGRIDQWYDRALRGVAEPDGDGLPPLLDARAEGRHVGTIRPHGRREPGGYGFEAALDVHGAMVPVMLYRRSDGRPLDPAPVVLHPLAGRLEGWFGRRIAGHAAPDPGGLPPTIEFRVDGAPIATLTAAQPRPDVRGFGFDAYLPVDGESVDVSVHRLPDGRALEGSPVRLHPRPPGPPPLPLAWDVPHVVAKPFAIPASGEVALFVTHAAAGVLKPHVPAYLAALRDAGVAVLLVAAVDRAIDLPPAVLDLVAGAVVRGNAGYDFAGWAHALKLMPEAYGARTLYLLNDSVFPAGGEAMAALLDRVRASAADLVALTASHEHRWHVQTYFLAVRPRLLSSMTFHRFMRSVHLLGSKDEVIQTYEVAFGPTMEAAGHRIEILYPSPRAINPTLFDWRGLIERGFPFVKLLLLRGTFHDADTAGWRDALDAAGFDVPLLEATLDFARGSVPEGPSADLLVHPAAAAAERPLRIALIARWADRGAAGDAARAMLAVLRRTGASLNLHPLTTGQATVSPPVDILDHAGPADIALVQLDPAAPLTGRQRQAIASAKRRIGYWTGAADELEGAAEAFPPFDRLWSADDAAAAALARMVEQPVALMAPPQPGEWAARATDYLARFAEALAADDAAAAPDRIVGDLRRGTRFADLADARGLRIVPVGPDGAVPALDDVPDSRDLWLAFAPADAVAAPAFAQTVRDQADGRMDVAIFYADDLALGEAEPIDQLRLKPGFDATLLIAQNHVGWPLIVRASAYVALGGFDAARGAAARDDLLLRANQAGMAIARIPAVLIATAGRRERVPREERRVMLRALPSLAGHDIVDGRAPELLAARRRFDAARIPAVSLLIVPAPAPDPSRRRRLIEAIAAVDWPQDRLSLILADADPLPTAPACEVRHVAIDPAEGDAACRNALWRAAESEQIVFLREDAVPTEAGWLRALLGHAVDEGVGGVGARLVGEDGRLRHAGLAPIKGAVDAPWRGRRRLAGTYQDWALAQREWSMVEGTVFATRRSVMALANGYDARFAGLLGDADLCLRLRSMGLRIVYDPAAEFACPATAEDRPAGSGEDHARFLARWGAWLDADPSYHPGLSRDGGEIAPRVPADAWYR
ncbi:rhamnan synthesis F family protein [Sphingomonas profundi]|uniref:rhamnan synthesis F family protein n=1 Tax=Alterirhizorhabdus profundi TaxID=2681549 RepID=UPI0012E8D483|nr:rhamnan synthesis F family protein [Sphingomonas profundi]